MGNTGRTIIPIISISLMPVFPANQVLSADQVVVTEDGREVLLKQDGTWKFQSNDRFANTEDGRRVRLKADGSWLYIGKASPSPGQSLPDGELDIKLLNAVIESYEKKVQKNTRVQKQTVVSVQLQAPVQAGQPIRLGSNDLSKITVNDNKGRRYDVLSIEPLPISLNAGEEITATIRIDGAPQWWKNVRSMNIVFSAGIAGLQKPVTLMVNVDDMDKKKVDGFEAMRR